MLYFMPVRRVEEEEEVENGFRERKLHGGTHVLWKSRPGWFDMDGIRVVA